MSTSVPPSSVGATEAPSSAVLTAAEIKAALQPLLKAGDSVVKTVHCRHYYSAVLLSNGGLVVLASNPQASAERLPGRLGCGSARSAGSASTTAVPRGPRDAVASAEAGRPAVKERVGEGALPRLPSPPTTRAATGTRVTSRAASSHGAASVAVMRMPSEGQPVVDVAAGDAHIVYCTAGGAVFSCGYHNTYGQLGDGSVWSSPADDDDGGRGGSNGTRVGGSALRGASARLPRLSPPTRIRGFGDAQGGAPSTETASRKGRPDSRPATIVPPTSLYGNGTGLVAHGASVSAATASTTTTATTAAAAAPTVADWAAVSGTEVPAAATTGSAPADRSYVARMPVLAMAPEPRPVVRIRAVSCGAAHTLLLTDDGRCLYACGRGDAGQLGTRAAPLLQPSFRSVPLLFGLPMRQILAAGNHSLVLLRTGKLFAFGANTCGQLGFGHTAQVRGPTAVPFRIAGPAPARDGDGGAPSIAAKPLAQPAGPPGDDAGPLAQAMLAKGERVVSANGTQIRRRAARPGVSPPGSANTNRSHVASATSCGSPAARTDSAGRREGRGANRPGGRAASPLRDRRVVDASTLAALRAPYASVEATYFPLRVPRLNGALESGQPCVLSVWGCATSTIVLTADLEWLSCGLPLTRAWRGVPRDGGPLYEGYGALGRPLVAAGDAYQFGRMAWTPMLQAALAAMAASSVRAVGEGGGEGEAGTGAASTAAAAPTVSGPVVECFSYPHATYVRLACPGGVCANASTGVQAAGAEVISAMARETPLSLPTHASQPPAGGSARAVLVEVGSSQPGAGVVAPTAHSASPAASPADPAAHPASACSGLSTQRPLSSAFVVPPITTASTALLLHHLGLQRNTDDVRGSRAADARGDDAEGHAGSIRLYSVPHDSGSTIPLRDCVAVL